MATWWRLAAVLETASLRQPAVIEPEDRRIPRSGCTEETTNSMHQASGGAERKQSWRTTQKFLAAQALEAAKVRNRCSALQPAPASRNSEGQQLTRSCSPASASVGVKAGAQAASRAQGWASSAKRCLTPPSSRAPTAKRQARAAVQRIICSAGLAFYCRCRLMSNVRPHNSVYART